MSDQARKTGSLAYRASKASVAAVRKAGGANSASIDLRGEIEHALSQKKVGFNELPTDGYTQYNLYATFRPMGSDSPISLRLAALNISNEDARLHTSFLKDVAPLPGRNIKISVDGKF